MAARRTLQAFRFVLLPLILIRVNSEVTPDVLEGSETLVDPSVAPTAPYSGVDYQFNATDEQRLLSRLFANYEPASRPTFNASHSVEVKFQFTLVQISAVDEVNQVLTTNVWLEQEWIDERLVWDPHDYNGLEKIRIPCSKLWLPDIVLYNSADDFTSGYMQSKAMVESNGRVFWPPPAKLRSTCKIDITFFPFDDQLCRMKFGSWTYDSRQVNVTKRHHMVETSNYVQSGEWDLLRVEVVRNEVKYPCCEEVYPDVTFTIVMRRRTLYYLFNIIFPCLWLTVLSLLGFWLPPDSGEKITLGITVLLAFSVFMLLIAENMPATSEFVPLIGVYLTTTMATTSLSIILTVFVLHLHHAGPNHQAVPKWLKDFMFGRVAPLLCMTTVKTYQRRSRLRRKRLNERAERSGALSGGPMACPSHAGGSRMLYTGGGGGPGLPYTCRTTRPPIGESPLPESHSTMQLLTPGGLASPPSSPPKFYHVYQSSNGGCETGEGGNKAREPLLLPRIPPYDGAESPLLPVRFPHHRKAGPPRQAQPDFFSASPEPQRGGEEARGPDGSSAGNSGGIGALPAPMGMHGGGGGGGGRGGRFLSSRDHYEQVSRHLRSLIKKQEEEEMVQETINDWRMLAFVLDRLFFWTFLAVALISTVTILLIMPSTKEEK